MAIKARVEPQSIHEPPFILAVQVGVELRINVGLTIVKIKIITILKVEIIIQHIFTAFIKSLFLSSITD
ncbi:MAG: hypothetical protein V4546_01650 [Bacteroidota bacterium]